MKQIEVFLWGNTPAFDLINFHQNEAKSEKPLGEYNVLYAGSGDPRNVIMTVAGMEDMIGKVSRVNIHLNDNKDMIVLRNLLILYLLLTKKEEGIDLAITAWYSSAMTDQ